MYVYPIVLEDDSLPHANMYSVMDHILYTEVENQKNSNGIFSSNPDPPLFVKFYHPERLISYLDIGRDRIPELVSVGLFFGSILTVIYVQYYRRDVKLSTSQGRTIWFMFVLYCALVVTSIGRSNVISLKHFLSPYLYVISSCVSEKKFYPILKTNHAQP